MFIEFVRKKILRYVYENLNFIAYHCVALGKLLNFSEAQKSHLQNGAVVHIWCYYFKEKMK